MFFISLKFLSENLLIATSSFCMLKTLEISETTCLLAFKSKPFIGFSLKYSVAALFQGCLILSSFNLASNMSLKPLELVAFKNSSTKPGFMLASARSLLLAIALFLPAATSCLASSNTF